MYSVHVFRYSLCWKHWRVVTQQFSVEELSATLLCSSSDEAWSAPGVCGDPWVWPVNWQGHTHQAWRCLSQRRPQTHTHTHLPKHKHGVQEKQQSRTHPYNIIIIIIIIVHTAHGPRVPRTGTNNSKPIGLTVRPCLFTVHLFQPVT